MPLMSINYEMFQTIFNLEETIIYTKNSYRWGWIQQINNSYLYGYIERFKPKKVNKKELLGELNMGVSRYVTLFNKNIISNEYIEKTLRIATEDDILRKYNEIKYIKSNKLNEIKQLLENNKYEVLSVFSLNEIIFFRNIESDWQVISFNKELNQFLIGFLDVDIDIQFYAVLNKSDIQKLLINKYK